MRKKEFLSIFCSLVLLAQAGFSQPKDEVKMRSWFENKNCTSLEIQFSSLKTNIKKSLQIQDQNFIQLLMGRIEAISPNGDEMISMIVAEEMNLNFNCDGKNNIIRFQNSMLKTPTTGFNSDDKNTKLGKDLYADLTSLLQPKIDHKIFKVVGLELPFADFNLTYKGLVVHEKLPSEPTVGPLSQDQFSIKDKAGKMEDVIITSGQLPPQPLEITVNGKKVTILTYENKKTGDRLYPNYFLIQK